MNRHTGRLALLRDEPPTGASLDGELDLPAVELSQPPAEADPISGPDPAPPVLPGVPVNPVERQLFLVNV